MTLATRPDFPHELVRQFGAASEQIPFPPTPIGHRLAAVSDLRRDSSLLLVTAPFSETGDLDWHSAHWAIRWNDSRSRHPLNCLRMCRSRMGRRSTKSSLNANGKDPSALVEPKQSHRSSVWMVVESIGCRPPSFAAGDSHRFDVRKDSRLTHRLFAQPLNSFRHHESLDDDVPFQFAVGRSSRRRSFAEHQISRVCPSSPRSTMRLVVDRVAESSGSSSPATHASAGSSFQLWRPRRNSQMSRHSAFGRRRWHLVGTASFLNRSRLFSEPALRSVITARSTSSPARELPDRRTGNRAGPAE